MHKAGARKAAGTGNGHEAVAKLGDSAGIGLDMGASNDDTNIHYSVQEENQLYGSCCRMIHNISIATYLTPLRQRWMHI